MHDVMQTLAAAVLVALALAMLFLLAPLWVAPLWVQDKCRKWRFSVNMVLGRYNEGYALLDGVTWFTKTNFRQWDEPGSGNRWKLEEYYSCLIRKRT